VTSDVVPPTIARLLEVVRLRDPGLATHGHKAAHIGAAIAMEMGLDRVDVDRAYLGGLLHDVGKLGVAEAVLWKPAGLDHGEWDQIRTHPEKGYRLIADLVHRDVAAAVLSHHERRDGAGYPYGIDARTLPTVVQIVQVADAYDAMTSVRPYQGALTAEAAVGEVLRCAGAQFDPEVAGALKALLAVAFDGPVDLRGTGEQSPAAPPDPYAATA